MTLLGREILTFNFEPIQLNRLNWRDYLNRPNPIAAALMAKMKIAPSVREAFPLGNRPKVKAECLRLLATLKLDPARTRLISGFVDTYLRLNAQETQIFQAEIARLSHSNRRASCKLSQAGWRKESSRA